jgi:TRAP-type C4-dicarboxylate transport system permease small subunit
MQAVKKVVDTILQWLSIGIVVLMTYFVTYQVVTRYVFNNPSVISEAIARYLFVWLTIFGGAYVFGKRDHMSLVFVRNRFPPRAQIVLEIVSELLIALFAVLVMIYGGRIYTAKQYVQMEPSLLFSMAYIYICLPIGGVLVLFYTLCNEVDLIKKLRGHSGPHAKKETR